MKTVKAAAALAAILMAGSAHAAITTYSDLSSFNAASGATTLFDFNSTPDGSFDGTSYDVGPFTLTGDSTAQFSDMQVVGGQVNANLCSCGPVTFGYMITFDAPITAFGFDLSGITSSGLTFTVGGDVFALPYQNGFVGFVSTAAFTTITVSGADEIHSFDNVRFSTSAVPEPASWAMMIGGFALAGGAMRRRKMAVSFA